MDAMHTAFEFVRSNDPVPKSAIGTFHLVAAESFNVDISMPTRSPMEYLARNELPRFVQISILHGMMRTRLIPRSEKTGLVNAGMFIVGLITPIFVDFFEQHRPWLTSTFPGDANKTWPPIANFVRVIRNFIAHHQGRVSFDNPNAPPVSWHHLMYEPKDKGYLVVGRHGDFGIGDLILLLMEFTGELDRLGCPPLTMTVPPLETLARERRLDPDNPEYHALAAKYGLQPPSRL
jgi:hypothetical protein